MTRTVADAAMMLQAIAGYDVEKTTSQQMAVSRYSSALRAKTSSLRSVTDAEAYAYHSESLAKTPELYQPFTRQRLRAAGEVTTVAYIQARRELVQLRHDIRKVFASVDGLVTPTAPIPPRTISEARADDPAKIPRAARSP